jgi:hypothetical protein
MINVYLGTDTTEVFNVTKDAVPYNLDTNSITRVEVYVYGNPLLDQLTLNQRNVDSADGDITWTADELSMRLGVLDVPEGNYKGRVKFYTAVATNGFVITIIDLHVTK